MSFALTEFQRAVLIALADACQYTLNAHVPVQAVQRGFPTHLRGDAKDVLKKLARKRYCIKHPTRGSMTFQLSQLGLDEARRATRT